MERLIIGVFLVGGLWVLPLFGQSLSATSFYDGYQFSYTINDEVLKDSPSWDPEAEEVPISLFRVSQIGRANLRRFIRDADKNWLLESVELQRIGEYKAKWIFEVGFFCYFSREVCRDDLRSFSIWVKLDGTVIEPTITVVK